MLTNSKKRDLRRRSHSLKPIVMVGQKGVTDAVVAEIDRALTDHELMKVKFRGVERAERDRQVDLVCESLDCESVLIIGATAVLYRENPD